MVVEVDSAGHLAVGWMFLFWVVTEFIIFLQVGLEISYRELFNDEN